MRHIAMFLLFTGSLFAHSITVRVFNQAHIPASDIRHAETEATYALGTAGVTVNWLNCDTQDCDNGITAATYEVLVRNGANARASSIDELGKALLPGNYAFIFYTPIKALAERSDEVSTDEVLGYVIAHEIGHLLFGPTHHDNTVMQASWNAGTLRRIADRQLRFKN